MSRFLAKGNNRIIPSYHFHSDHGYLAPFYERKILIIHYFDTFKLQSTSQTKNVNRYCSIPVLHMSLCQKKHDAPRVDMFAPTDSQLLLLTVLHRTRLSYKCSRLIRHWRRRDFCESSNLMLPLGKASLVNCNGQCRSGSCAIHWQRRVWFILQLPSHFMYD